MVRQIYKELRNHAPFTVFGALTGIVIILLSQDLPFRVSYAVFYVLHPMHVVLSALVTASMYQLHICRQAGGKCNLYVMLGIGYAGSIGMATLSDSVIPYLGEALLGMPNRGIHLGFIEKWWLVNPLAVLGIGIAYFAPATRFPHAGHVLLSTWASLVHIIMASPGALNWLSYIVVFLFLFVAVWIPCCVSDIIFPLLFVRETEARSD